MAKSENQKLKLLYLQKIIFENTDEEHGLTLPEIIAELEKYDIQVHIPEGAVPKDGPSAGITMTLAILSALTGRKVSHDTAMTGEITLRGRVLPIGGLKEKLLAAKNAGINTVFVPCKNKPDVEEISQEITEGIDIIFVDNETEIISKAFTGASDN